MSKKKPYQPWADKPFASIADRYVPPPSPRGPGSPPAKPKDPWAEKAARDARANAEAEAAINRPEPPEAIVGGIAAERRSGACNAPS